MRLPAITAVAALSACAAGEVNPGIVLPEPPAEGSLEARGTEACSRKLAQAAANLKPKGVTARVIEAAMPVDEDRYSLPLLVSINYGNEEKTARVECVINSRGAVLSIGEPVPVNQ